MNETEGNPVEELKKVMDSYRSPFVPGLPRFNGGAVGYFGYDLARHYENLPCVPKDDLRLPDSYFMFMDEIVAFDHLKQKIHIIVNMETEGDFEANYFSAAERIMEIRKEISSALRKARQCYGHAREREDSGYAYGAKKTFQVESNTSKEEFCGNVVKAKEYIKNGDIFQVVLSQRLSVKTDSDPFDVYRVLRVVNPSPYMYYLKFGDFTIAGASPEMLVRVEDGVVETCPIAGTRKRGGTEEEDALLERELLSDE